MHLSSHWVLAACCGAKDVIALQHEFAPLAQSDRRAQLVAGERISGRAVVSLCAAELSQLSQMLGGMTV